MVTNIHYAAIGVRFDENGKRILVINPCATREHALDTKANMRAGDFQYLACTNGHSWADVRRKAEKWASFKTNKNARS